MNFPSIDHSTQIINYMRHSNPRKRTTFINIVLPPPQILKFILTD